MHFVTIVLKFLARALLWVAILLGIWSIVEMRLTLSDYKQQIGTLASESEETYTYENRRTHIQYQKTFNYQNVNIRYIDHGPSDGSPVFLLHGTPTSSWLYRKMIPVMAKKGWRVIAPDMVGFGASSRAFNTLLLSSEQQAKRINALMRELNLDSAIFVGHDQGSLRVQEFYTAYPDKVRGLVLLNGIYHRDGFHPPQGFGEENLTTQVTSRAMGSLPFGRIFAYGAMARGLKNYKLATWTMIEGYLYPLLDGANQTYHDFITSFADIQQDLRRYQREIGAREELPPTMVIRGAHDAILVAAEQVPVVKNLFDVDQADIHILDDASHFIQEEEPEYIVSLIDAFFTFAGE